MTAKEYLSQALNIDKSMKSKKKRIQELKDLQTNISSKLTKDKVKSSPDHDKLGKLSDDIIDLDNSYFEDVCELMEIQRKIKKVIGGVKGIDLTYHLVLEERYLNCKEWKDIADDNDYSESRLFDLHKEALRELTNHILNRYFEMI